MKIFSNSLLLIFVFFSLTVAAFPQAGRIDSSFGYNGIVTTAVNVTGSSKILSSFIQEDGKIVAAGSRTIDLIKDFAVMRFNPDGTPDNTFGTAGIAATETGTWHDEAASVKIQQDGKIIAGGYCYNIDHRDFVLVRYNPDGSLDYSFGEFGIVTTDIDGSNDVINSIAIQDDDKIIAAGYSVNGLTYDFCLARYNTDGSIDTTFGDGGIVITAADISYDAINSIAIQEDQKIIAAGCSDLFGTSDFTLLRYNTDGQADTSFGTNGVVVIVSPSSDDSLLSVMIQNDGKIICGGYTDYSGNNNFTLVRLNSDGTPDTSFGTAGITAVLSPSDDRVFSVAIQEDQKIIAAGVSDFYGTNDFTLVRFNGNGTLDGGFGLNGAKSTDVGTAADEIYWVGIQDDQKIITAGLCYEGSEYCCAIVRYNRDGAEDNTFGNNGIVTTTAGRTNDEALSLAVQPDGKYIAAGSSDNNFLLLRYEQDGKPDTSFGENGVVVTNLGDEECEANAVALQEDGKIVAAGSSFDSGDGYLFAIVRYNSDGTLDETFDSDGIVLTDISIDEDDEAFSVVIQSDQKIIAGGYADNGSYDEFALVRYNPDGNPDLSFGTGGRVTTYVGGNSRIRSLLLQPDGKIVAGGYAEGSSNTDFALVRYNSNGTPDFSFGTSGIKVHQVGPQTDNIRSLLLQDDGKIVAAGYAMESGYDNFALVRYNSDGSFDESFGTNGKVITPVGMLDDYINSAALQDDGKIVAAGTARVGLENRDFALARYDSDGNPDPTFGTGGIVITKVGTSKSSASSVAMLEDGKIITAGYSEDLSCRVITLIRYNGDPPTGVDENLPETPASFSLGQNYPNPFNPSTNFEFRIADFGFVSLRIYDVLGKEVAVLVNEEMMPGKYKITFNSQQSAGLTNNVQLSSGVYFYRLQSGNFADTKKFILIK